MRRASLNRASSSFASDVSATLNRQSSIDSNAGSEAESTTATSATAAPTTSQRYKPVTRELLQSVCKKHFQHRAASAGKRGANEDDDSYMPASASASALGKL